MIEIIEKGSGSGAYFDAKLRGQPIGQFLLQSNNGWKWRNSTLREQFCASELIHIAQSLRKLNLINQNICAGDRAKACNCGSVNFALRDDYAIECNKCGEIHGLWLDV